MSAASDYLENEVLDHILGKGTRNFTSPSNLYVALFTSSAGLETNSPSAEVSGGSYTRQIVSFNTASGGSATNNGLVQFPTATANWGNVTHMAIMDASTSGNVIFWGALNAAKTVQTDDVFQFSNTALTISLA
jgi:hypothetical protein